MTPSASSTRLRAGRRLASLFAATALSAAIPLATASPAGAALAGNHWTAQTLPANYLVGGGGPAVAPVSCVPGTQFCLAVVADSANLVNGYFIGQAALVTTDGGQHWTGYATLPSTFQVTTASCGSPSSCWVAGEDWHGKPAVAATSDGGKTWTDETPASWSSTDWMPRSIDCVSATTCWLAGQDGRGQSLQDPFILQTTDGGANWTSFSNLPSFTSPDPNGTYTVNGISCTTATTCVAVGGLNEVDGTATVISTTDGGATWALSTDPLLAGIQDLWGISCLPGQGGVPDCQAVGSALSATGPVDVASTDGGATWSGMETYDNTGWLSSVACADLQHCWAAGAGTKVALVGTGDGGSSWSAVRSNTSNEDGSVSCLSATVCVATTDNALWVTTDGGGLAGTRTSTGRTLAAAAASTSVTLPLPRVSPRVLSARAGRAVTVTGQYRAPRTTNQVSVVITSPTGSTSTATGTIGLNDYFSVVVPSLQRGVTTVSFSVGAAKAGDVAIHGYPAAAPKVRSLSVHAGPASGGTKVIITGAHLRGTTKVLFGPSGSSRPGTHLKVLSATRLRVVAPAGRGAGYVTVVTGRGGPSALTGRALYNFVPRPTVTKLSPRSGPRRGGNKVTLTGAGFAFVRAVRFGSRLATHIQVLSATKIVVVAPRGSGTVAVRVVDAGGRSAATSASRYTY